MPFNEAQVRPPGRVHDRPTGIRPTKHPCDTSGHGPTTASSRYHHTRNVRRYVGTASSTITCPRSCYGGPVVRRLLCGGRRYSWRYSGSSYYRSSVVLASSIQRPREEGHKREDVFLPASLCPHRGDEHRDGFCCCGITHSPVCPPKIFQRMNTTRSTARCCPSVASSGLLSAKNGGEVRVEGRLHPSLHWRRTAASRMSRGLSAMGSAP